MPLGDEQLGELVLGGGASEYEHSIEEGVRKLLVDAIAISVAPRRVQGQTLPMIAYRLERDEHEHVLVGRAGFAKATLELEIQSREYGDLGSIAKQVRDVLDGFDGMAWDRVVFSATHEREYDDVERPDDGSQKVIYKRVQEFEVLYPE